MIQTSPMNPRASLRTLFAAALTLLATTSCLAASFTAEMVDTRGGKTRTGTFHFQDGSYRYTAIEDGRETVIIVDGKSGLMRALMPEKKVYIEAGPEHPINLWVNPFACFAHYARTRDLAKQGAEAVGGVPCVKQVASGGGQVFATAWVSDEWAFPLKVETQLDGRRVELLTLRAGPVEDSLFKLPEGYSLMKEPEPEVPAWAAQVPSTPVLTPPFEKTLKAGEMVRVLPVAGRHISLSVTNRGKESSAFFSVAFGKGRPLSEPGGNTMNLDEAQEVSAVHTETPAQAEAIVMRVVRGSLHFKAAWAAPETARRPFPEASPEAADSAESGKAPGFSLSAPHTAEVAERILVEWMGSGSPEDAVVIAKPGQGPGSFLAKALLREGSPVKLWTPAEPGDYELRVVAGKPPKVMTTLALPVTDVKAMVDPSASVPAGDWIEVQWSGPAREGDIISVAKANQGPGSNLGSTPVKAGNPLRLRAPSEPGDYEVRYILSRGPRKLASAPVTTRPVSAELEAPAQGVAGTELEVYWTGPGYAEDYICVARTIQSGGSNLSSQPTRKGNPLKLKLPREPGDLELRYVVGRGNRVLVRKPLKVVAP